MRTSNYFAISIVPRILSQKELLKFKLGSFDLNNVFIKKQFLEFRKVPGLAKSLLFQRTTTESHLFRPENLLEKSFFQKNKFLLSNLPLLKRKVSGRKSFINSFSKRLFINSDRLEKKRIYCFGH